MLTLRINITLYGVKLQLLLWRIQAKVQVVLAMPLGCLVATYLAISHKCMNVSLKQWTITHFWPTSILGYMDPGPELYLLVCQPAYS